MTEEYRYLDTSRLSTFYCEVDKCDIVQRLKQENEALRNQCNKCKQYAIEQNNRRLLNENEKLKEKYLSTLQALTAYSTQFTGILQENVNYEKALEEIREIADVIYNTNCNYVAEAHKILNKINEVLKC